jgi:hypothetical protein
MRGGFDGGLGSPWSQLDEGGTGRRSLVFILTGSENREASPGEPRG